MRHILYTRGSGKHQARMISMFHAARPGLFPAQPNRIALPRSGGIDFVELDHIHYCQADGNYTRVYTSRGIYVISKTLGVIHGVLPDAAFIRVHQSYVVNVQAVRTIYPLCIELKDNTSIPVSRTRRTEIKARLLDHTLQLP